MLEMKADGWVKENEEGPLKLRELHNKVRREQEGIDYNEDYDESKKKRRREDKPTKSGGNFFAGTHSFFSFL